MNRGFTFWTNLRIGRVADPRLNDELMERLRGEATGCYSWSNGPGDRYAAHSHGYEKVLYCTQGSITFVLEREGKRLLLKAGDRMVLPAGTVHSAVVGDAGCTCIEGRG
jgi:quercetin dioxygenase-like cupin family protein